MKLHFEDVVTEVIQLYSKFASSDYTGEPVTCLEHLLQTAEFASSANCSEEVVLGALFHDIGHLLDLEEAALGKHVPVID